MNIIVSELFTHIGLDELGITDDPFCGCTIIDKDHEATITVEGLEDYFRLLYLKVTIVFIVAFSS